MEFLILFYFCFIYVTTLDISEDGKILIYIYLDYDIKQTLFALTSKFK